MLLSVLRGVFGRREAVRSDEDQLPLVRQELMRRGHDRAPIQAHLEIAMSDLRVAGLPVADLVARCLAESGARVPPLKALHRPLATYFLARYYLYALGLEGARAECGVFQGTSALLLSRFAQAVDPAHDGTGLHLIDSFEGLSEPGVADRLVTPGAHAGGAAGELSAPLDRARRALAAFPGVAFHKGWIPSVFDGLPETRWSFVHVDVDLYEPTYAALEYFHPRLVEGGVIVCDDYGSALFPGAQRAWNRFCNERGIGFVVLDTGQSVILRAPAGA